MLDNAIKLQSVVAVRAHVPDTAFTANALGTLREGSGVVIGPGGLVLTIGYLITEAEEVWLTTQDGKVVAAHALGSIRTPANAYASFSPPFAPFGVSAAWHE